MAVNRVCAAARVESRWFENKLVVLLSPAVPRESKSSKIHI